ncbi:MAG: hypothetical protein AB7V13_23130 [Pseudorhodoplanes sp.]|uniref:hypothetical protein n=1 Tax=Pseudorhodoplanes sp. TaxID=1934341 RepID=UPI003D0E763F
MMLQQRGGLIRVALAVVVGLVAASVALAQPRGTPTRSSPPPLPPTGHQSEPVDLNEGKSPAELFQAGCAVCHQSAAGLAKGRREGDLTNFLRQHYTSSVQHAGALANFLTSGGRGAPAVAAPGRQAPVERPPAPVGRRTPEDDRKSQEAAKPPEREPASKRKPPAAAAVRTPPPAPVTAPPLVPEAAGEAGTSASSPPVEEKPAGPEIPL